MRLRSALLFACAISTYSNLNAAPKVPLSAFVQENKYSLPRLSPDGKYIALTVRTPSGGGQYARAVTIYSLPAMTIAGAVAIPKFHLPTHYLWTGTTRLIIVTAMESAPGQPDVNAEVVATEIDGSKQKYLYGWGTTFAGRRGEPFGTPWTTAYMQEMHHAPNNHFLLGVQPNDEKRTYLFDVDSVSASQTRLASVPANDMRFLLQPNDKPRIAYGVGEQGQAIVYHYNERSDSWDQQNGKFGKYYRPLQFSSDGKEFVAQYSADGGPQQLIKENLATGARTTLFADPRGDVVAVMTGVDVGLPVGASSRVGIPVPHYFDGGNEDDKQLHQLLSAQFPGSYVSFQGATRDGRTVLFSVDSDRQPGEYYVLYRDTMRADLLFSVRDTIVPQDMAERRPIAFKARDGLDLYGYLTLPQRATAARLPLVVFPHDGPAGHYDDWFFDRDAQFLASRGYAVLQVNFRGSARLGINFEQAGYRQWGTKIQDDLVDGIKWAIAQGDIDGGRVCAYGTGFGAYSALMLAAREPALIKCAVGQGGFYDLNLLYKPVIEGQEAKIEKLYGKQIGRDKAELDRFSPLTQAHRITAPVLLVHGEKDSVASISHATAMRAALVKAERTPEWLVAPDEGHEFYDPANVTLFYQKLEGFLGKHIGQ